ncbi:hypothetical protein GCM10011519_22320 [Marmoricola endophyticus]|uniref:Uncharacterized protein n=1 Tax=Marmoricola endophyticus TaxID=2040280 RepID=A0A917F4P0_9ACTN|nr:hypothetical protein [Marmoricola endophyticus]GGF47812.1 hypothetical protein GCM10011519_22320 [Marmoricola endophyticus]
MVNTAPSALAAIERPVRAYVVVAVATVLALALLTALGSAQATTDAWVHAVIVVVLAALLPLRLRAARRGSGRALAAVGVIAAVLAVANLVEAVLPGLFPVWLRLVSVLVVVLMAWTLLGVRAALGRAGRPD